MVLPRVKRLAEVRAMPSRIVAGLMTGTSMDGLDIALVRVPAGVPRRFELLASGSDPMPGSMRERLLQGGELSLAEAMRLDRELGQWFADALARLVERCGWRPDLIGSHGQTVYHEHGRITCQLGEAAWLAQRFGCPVVCDFRRNDIAAGGCGAPLVPIVDLWLLGDPDHGVVALNIGGIANLTAIPAGAEPSGRGVIGFDTGPGNMVLDGLAHRFTDGRQPADLDGRFAALGRVRENLLTELLRHAFFELPPPRSAGREQFGDAYIDHVLQRAGPVTAQDWYDLFATATELTVRAIVQALNAYVLPHMPVQRLVVSGGGARNPELYRRLTAALPGIDVVVADRLGLDADHKEAIAFALLASARLDEVAGNLPAVTGAAAPVLLGKIAEC